jgi:hypothetical protein
MLLIRDAALTPPHPPTHLFLLLLLPCSGGEQSTSSEVLQALAAQHPLPGLILQHRKLHKLKTGFMNSLGTKLAELQQQQRAAASGSHGYTAGAMSPAGPCALLDEDCSAVTRDSSAADSGSSSSGIVRIRGSFLQTNTATGRLSMDDPALQTIPRPVDFQLELPAAASQPNCDIELSPAASGGAVRLQQVQVNVRASFVAPPGWVLLSADYSQIELRLVRQPRLGRDTCIASVMLLCTEHMRRHQQRSCSALHMHQNIPCNSTYTAHMTCSAPLTRILARSLLHFLRCVPSPGADGAPVPGPAAAGSTGAPPG